MALKEYRIDTFRFLAFSNPPNTCHRRSEVIVRPGLAGGEVWRTRRQPVPFTLRTWVDVASILAGEQLYRQYQDLSLRESLVDIVYRDVSSSTGLKTAYYILDTNIVELIEVGVWCGRAINPPSVGLLQCEWLIAPFDATLGA